MDLHKVRRLSRVLVTSQLRSGRSSSDPRSIFGQPAFTAGLDVTVFLVAFTVVSLAVRSLTLGAGASGAGSVGAAVNGAIPFFPLAAVGVVLIAGTMFELSATAKFSGSDAVNWMPITPAEYVVSSSSAIAYTYSPAVALLLGGLLAFSVAEGALVTFVLTLILTVVALFEGALLVEMVRSLSTRAGSVGSGRRGPATFVLRAVVLISAILVLDLALNPVFLFEAVQRLSAFPAVSAAIPLFWSSRALSEWLSGQYLLGVAFAAAQVGFVVVLGLLAAQLRVRYWVPSATEIRLDAHRYARNHPVLSRIGLSRPEAALVSKDLRGLIRRKEMMPPLVVPIVLVLLLLIEGSGFGTLTTILWVAWVGGFFALLLSVTSVGQERRSLQLLFAFPITGRTVFRAKAAAALLPVVVAAAAMSFGVGLVAHFSTVSLLGVVLLTVVAAVILSFWGLVFAGRYSDFQERPRPQFLRPSAMLGATLSGVALLSAIVLPGAFVVADPSPTSLGFVVLSVGIAVTVGISAYVLARSGFDALFRELPF
jgi:predicted permease